MKFGTHTKVPPIFRQAFVLAGTFVLTGVALGYTVDPLFYLLSALVGVGLWVSALLGHCPMALVIAKMPWNRKER